MRMPISEVKRNLDGIKYINGSSSKETKKEMNVTKSYDLQNSPEMKKNNQRISLGVEELTISKNAISRSNTKTPGGSR